MALEDAAAFTTHRVRLATRRDLDVIGDLWVELMSLHAMLDPRFGLPPQGRAHYIRHAGRALHDRAYRVLVAEREQCVIGYIMGYIADNPPILPYPRYGFIADLCVTATARGQGAGRALAMAMIDWFTAHGLTNVQVNVAHSNPVSQRFWRRLGCTDYLDHMWMTLPPDTPAME